MHPVLESLSGLVEWVRWVELPRELNGSPIKDASDLRDACKEADDFWRRPPCRRSDGCRCYYQEAIQKTDDAGWKPQPKLSSRRYVKRDDAFKRSDFRACWPVTIRTAVNYACPSG